MVLDLRQLFICILLVNMASLLTFKALLNCWLKKALLATLAAWPHL